MNAEHITNKENFQAIQRDGYIRPRSEPREFGEQGGCFAADWHAQDNQFVFFVPGRHSEFYRTLTYSYGSEVYGFVFDAEFLILGLKGRVGPDLMTKYDDLMHDCAQAVAAELGPKPIDEISLQEFLEKHEISVPQMIADMRKNEGSYYQEVLDGMLNADASVPGAMDGLKLFKEQVGEIQEKHRVSGEAALQLLRSGENPIGTPLEILVPGPVPIHARLSCIVAGEEVIR